MSGGALSPPLLEAIGISKSFPGVCALRGVSIRIRTGEVHAVVGENGAGKSTLMHILAGVFAPDEGTLMVSGKRVSFSNPRAAQAAGIAMVFQERSLAGPLSVAENVFFGRQPVGRCGVIDSTEMRRRTEEILSDLDISLSPDAAVEDLSPAEQQMVEIAKALSLEARLLVLDEPTSTLTATETTTLFRVVGRLRERGAGIVYISHRMAEVFRICDRITVLRDGEWQGAFDCGELSEDQLIKRMVGRALSFDQDQNKRRADRGAAALEVEGLSDDQVLDGITFNASTGQITALSGLSGAGRTELAMAIFGARPITAGRILVAGRPVQIRSPRDAIRAGIGYLPEDRKDAGLFLEMSIAANFGVAGLEQFGCWWLNDRSMEAQSAAAMARLRLTNPNVRWVQELSGGNQQKILLARWLLVRPPILIVDEPTRGVDIGAKMEVHQLLRELACAGTAVVLISSELPEVISLADRILVMREGCLAGEIPRDQATEESILRLATLPRSSRSYASS